jgi:hypothetical protein
MRPRTNTQVCFIAGVGHSGSTLLGMILGGHPSAFYAGEAKKSRFFGDLSAPLKKRACKICGESCPVWGGMHPPYDPDVYEELSRRTRRPRIVDSAKGAEWIREQRGLLLGTSAEVALLLLVRDGRAVFSSRLRKYPELSAEAHIRKWSAQMKASEALFDDHQARGIGPTGRVRYEELVSDPEGEVRRVGELLGLPDPEAALPAMLAYEEREHHPLGGNDGVQFVATRRQRGGEQPVRVSVPERSRDYYENLRGGFRLDLRWKRELSGEQLERFEALAGEQNIPYRWDP